MPLITKISTQKRPGRYNIFLDNHYAFSVSESILTRYMLVKGTKLDKLAVQQIQDAEQTDQVYQKALNYLGYQPRSRAELKQHLVEQNYSEALIESTIKRLQALHYVDDLSYAQAVVRTAVKTTLDGPQKIACKLQQKQVESATIHQALQLFPRSLQLANATKLAQKVKQQAHNQTLQRTRLKAQQRLLARGYSPEVIDQVLANCNWQSDPEAESALLTQVGTKLWSRYQQQSQARSKLYAALRRRGFAHEAICTFLENLD